jgi:hypothetical protein
MKKNTKFKFEKCANHFFSGCEKSPEVEYGIKEICLNCYAQEIWEDLAYGIKYGKDKNFYKNKVRKFKAFD